MLVGFEGTGQTGEKRPRFTRWIALLATVLLLAGIAAAVWSRRAAERAPAPQVSVSDRDPTPEGEADIPDDATHRKALAGDKEKSKWVAVVPEVDVSGLSQKQLDLFLSAANTQRCTCGCGYTLAGCRVYDSTCEKSGPRVAALLDSVRAGQIRSAAGLRAAPAHPG
jgi:hypothetical protein